MARSTIFKLRFNRNFTTFVKTSHGHVKVDFAPIILFGRTENSQFSTADKEVIEALKRHALYGSLFYIEENGEESTSAGSSDKGQKTLHFDENVKSKNAAIMYLKEHFDAQFSQTADITKMKEEARDVYGVIFENWK